MAIKTNGVTCGDVPAYYTRPGRPATDGGVLLLPSIHGREKYVMDYVHALAEAGPARNVTPAARRSPTPARCRR